MTVLTTHGPQLFSPTKVIFTGIRVLLTVSRSQSSLLSIRVASELPGCEGCSYEPQVPHQPLQAYSLLQPMLEILHRDSPDEGIDGVTREGYSAATPPSPFQLR